MAYPKTKRYKKSIWTPTPCLFDTRLKGWLLCGTQRKLSRIRLAVLSCRPGYNRLRRAIRVELAFRLAFTPFVSEFPSRLQPAADVMQTVFQHPVKSVPRPETKSA